MFVVSECLGSKSLPLEVWQDKQVKQSCEATGRNCYHYRSSVGDPLVTNTLGKTLPLVRSTALKSDCMPVYRHRNYCPYCSPGILDSEAAPKHRNCISLTSQGISLKKFIGTVLTLTGQTATVHSSPGPAPNLLTLGPISSGLVPNPPPAAPYVPPTNKELEILFQPMFDEYFESSTVDRLVPPAQLKRPIGEVIPSSSESTILIITSSCSA
ncbi:hypothetical protein Tco_1032320 [Tanacetum coccineum]|uniref:Uncharacterized protein n=1 Tax=Tanacetum coccineum TaxID=301880 RepID=A0ABQ5GCB6_9ASTR